MRPKLPTILSGLVLILVGGFALAAQLGYFENQTPQFWMATFAGVAVLFLVAYILSGIRAWGWLFPTLICGAVALTIFLSEAGLRSSIIGMPILLSIGLPFLVPFALDTHKNWWALIPAWVMAMLSLTVALADQVKGEWVAAILMFGFALPFFVVFLVNRSRWWALIPGFVFSVVAVTPLIAMNLKGEYVGGLFNIFIGLPFLVVYFASRKTWWAIIPAGVMISIGLMVILIGLLGANETTGSFSVGAMFLGWAATFGLVWLRRDLHPTDWAKYPAVVCVVLAVAMALGAAQSNLIWPVLLIAGGLLLLYFGFRRKAVEL